MDRQIAIFAALALAATAAQGQLTVSTQLTPQQLVQDVLAGNCVNISNVTYNGSATPPAGTGRGSFTAVNSNLGIAEGVILSSGNVVQAANPASFFASSTLSTGTDPDLVQLSGGQTINDRSVLEFDFVPEGDSISFRFVFASEEYPTFVCSGFNDAFGFFLSGPGIAGPFTNSAINLALVPGTTVPITINTVNSGTPGGGYPASTCAAQDPNWQANSIYYVNNAGGTTVAYDGFTTVLTARAAVTCGETYHIKLAIGDAGDSAFDSAVFLEAGSFSSAPFVPELTPGPTIVDNTIIRSCYPLEVGFVRTTCDDSLEETVGLSFAGTVTMGVDVVPNFPDEIVFAPGVTDITIPFQVPIGTNEAGEWVIIVTSIDCNGNLESNEFTFIIDPAPPITIEGYDLNIQCGETVELTPDVVGGFVPYTFDWGAAGTGGTISVTPTGFTVYPVTVTDTCGQSASTQFAIGLIPLPPIFVSILGPDTVVEGCESTSINIIRPQGVPGALTINLSYQGTATQGEDFEMPNSVVIPADVLNLILPFEPLEDNIDEDPEDVVIIVSFTDDCGRTVDASVTITIIDAPPIFLETENYQIECAPDSMIIEAWASGGYGGQLTLEWSNGGVGDFTYVDMQMTNTYQVTATDLCGRSVSASVVVDVDCDIIIPNVFSPNNDGVNDFWVIEGIANRNNTVKVFNRWGQVVFEANNYRNNWRALGLPDGTYFYEVIVDKPGEKPQTGHLTILRNSW